MNQRKLIIFFYLIMAMISFVSFFSCKEANPFEDGIHVWADSCFIFCFVFISISFLLFKKNLWARYFVFGISGFYALILILALLAAVIFGNSGAFGGIYLFTFNPQIWYYLDLPKLIVDRSQIENFWIIYCLFYFPMLLVHLFCLLEVRKMRR